MRIAVDAMGGDHAPAHPVDGAVAAGRHHGIGVDLIGREAEHVAAGQAAGLFSAGHTGASVVAAHAVFGMLPGADRPALAPSVPVQAGSAVLPDAGATVECKPVHLLQFAHMGAR
ncbi:MAG: hypothetical protein FJW22_11690 [Acidimicrobiia bacterium]|nr:hypothetical protein [Acidimicrobiia bacterium]